MFKYILGLLKNLFNPAVSLFTKIDSESLVSRKAKVYGKTQVTNSTIGDYSYVGRNSRVVHADVGKFCSISGAVRLGMGKHTLDKLSTSPIFTERHNSTKHQWTDQQTVNPFKRVTVGNDVWIGTGVMVMGGVAIGDGAVIGAGAIVTKDVPPYAVVAGVPAKIIRYRFTEEQIQILEEVEWWNKTDEELRNNISLFQEPVDKELIMKLNGIIRGGYLVDYQLDAQCWHLLYERRCAA